MVSEHQLDPEVEQAERRRRRRVLLLTVVLLLGLPLYLLAASTVVGAITDTVTNADGSVERPVHWTVELLIYLVLGLVWAFPLKGLAKGVSRAADQANK